MNEADKRWREKNPEKYNAQVNAWRKRNPDSQRDYAFRRKYGITLIEYNEMMVAQEGKCAVCKREETGNRRQAHFVVDHDHVLGVVRGLLCHHCNIALGAAEDSSNRLRALADYLDRAVCAVIDAGNLKEANEQISDGPEGRTPPR